MSEYQSTPAVAIFNNNSVTVRAPGIGGNFIGQHNAAFRGGSSGVLYYRRMPEGKFTMTIVPTTSKTEINFNEEGAVANEDVDPKFVGGQIISLTLIGSGSGTWASINMHQQVYLLSLVSNAIRKEKNSVKALQLRAEAEIVKNVNRLGWVVTWGPVVWKNDPDNQLTGPDHVWFVAKKRRAALPDIYAISIAGSATIYNHIIHNAGVVQVVDFTTWATNTPPSPTSTIVDSGTYVAFGTAQGVHTVRSYPSPVAADEGKTLSNFLKDLPRASGTKFIFTGFSLGGALAPTLALALKKDSAVFKDADEVLTYPIAGASPGNKGFANLFAEKFPKLTTGSTYQVWNGNVANSLDIVPHGWSTDSEQSQNLGKIPKLYGNDPPLAGVEKKVNLAKDAACKSGIVYIPLQSTVFSPDAVAPPENEEKFRVIVKKQHGKAYQAYFGTTVPTRTTTLAVHAELEVSIVEDELATVKLEDAVEVDQEEEDFFPDLVLDI